MIDKLKKRPRQANWSSKISLGNIIYNKKEIKNAKNMRVLKKPIEK